MYDASRGTVGKAIADVERARERRVRRHRKSTRKALVDRVAILLSGAGANALLALPMQPRTRLERARVVGAISEALRLQGYSYILRTKCETFGLAWDAEVLAAWKRAGRDTDPKSA